MWIKSILVKKAAFLIAAFFISSFSVSAYAADSLDEVKKDASQLLLKKQKAEAIQAVAKFLKNEGNKAQYTEAYEFLVKVSQTFLSKEAQEAYEGSLNATLDSSKEAQKLVDTCLQLEPNNIDCLVQKIRLCYRQKDRYMSEKYFKLLSDQAKGTTLHNWVDLFLQKDQYGSGFKDKSFLKRFLDRPSEEGFVFTVLEIERSFQAKNFSRARSGIETLEKCFPEYPENIYFKQKLDVDSSEEKSPGATENNVMYLTKCKSLTKSMARKFRYDFDLCQRGQQ